jgi:hypothetical protein
MQIHFKKSSTCIYVYRMSFVNKSKHTCSTFWTIIELPLKVKSEAHYGFVLPLRFETCIDVNVTQLRTKYLIYDQYEIYVKIEPFFYVPLRRRKGILLYTCTAVCWSVCRSTSSFRSFSLHWLHILKWNLVCRFIISRSRSIYVLGTIEQFLKVMSLGLWQIPIIYSFCSFSLHRLHIVGWNFNWYSDLS